MYPPIGSSPVDIDKTVTLPGWRKVDVLLQGVNEYDTNAFVLTDLQCWWTETGEELTNDEYNMEVQHNGQDYYLHELIVELALES